DYTLAWTTQADVDLDRIPDTLDNCRLTANPKQTDSDGDGYGNRCDCDLNNDGRVDGGDFGFWRLLATVPPASDQWNPAADFNENKRVDVDDYTIFKNRNGIMAPYE
ncbi:MAG: hypothetical protein HKP58_15140, partial [Desulfatitalea sp.]|nr:thrombospondin type 3 repeat-containing protein [Desulfatitalea sp.]NNK01744.1 hypothetical protein [Desulfatitalea sp.]